MEYYLVEEAVIMNKAKLTEVAEALDRLSNADISGRGVIHTLYKAARDKVDKPVLLAAIDLLRHTVQPGDPVVIATGWIDQPLVAPQCGESDGPAGAVVLARALRLALKAVPLIVTTDCLIPGMQRVAQAAGFHCLEPEVLHHSVERNKLLTLSVLPFPREREQARSEAVKLIRRFKPVACIAIECGGMNDAGMIHNMGGQEISEPQSKLDYLFIEARREGIATLAIGDGGNEIGMANIAGAIRENLLSAKSADSISQPDVIPSTPVDLLLTAAISNWGAYALAAVLAASTGVLDALHKPEAEKRLLSASADAGFHDPIYGAVAPSVDGCSLETHLAMVHLIEEAVLCRQV
jgi:hypothetical protein